MHPLSLSAASTAAAFLLASAAQAATVSHVWNFTTEPSVGFRYDPVVYTKVAPGFDSALGTLTRVEFSMSSDVTLNLTWANASHPTIEVLAEWTSYADTQTRARPQPEAPPYDLGLPHRDSIYVVARPGGYTGAIAASGHFEAFTATDYTSVPLDTWVDADRVDLLYSERFHGFWDSAWYVDLTVSGLATHRMTLSYIYTPSIPEPSTWAMMIVGLGAAGTMLRRQSLPRGSTA